MKNLFTPRRSLLGQILNHFFFEEDDGSGGAAGETQADEVLSEFSPADGEPLRAESPQERVDGEQLPDFGTIGKPKGSVAAPEAPKVDKVPKTEEKPATGQPEKKAEPKKPAAEPAKVAKTTPEPEKPADKPPGESEKPAKIMSDAEIDALQPKPGAPTRVVADFKVMREKMKQTAAAARAIEQERETLRAEVETLKQSTGKLPEDVQKRMEELENFHMLFQAENNPRFKEQFETPIVKAEETVYTLLQKHGLKAPLIEEIKASAKAAGGNIEAWPKWKTLFENFTNPVDQQELLSALKGRRDAVGAREMRLKELGGSREKFQEAVGNMDGEERNKFAQGVEKASIELAAKNDWIIEKDIPANATPDQKAAIESANATVKARANAFGDHVRAAYARDPDKVAELAIKAVKADYYEEQLATVTKERDLSAARVRELEARLGKIRTVGRSAHVEAPVETTAVKQAAGIGGDGQSAIENFFAKK